MSTSDPWYRPRGFERTLRCEQRGRLLGTAVLAAFCLLAVMATPARAATVSLYAAPAVAGTGDCSSPANACTIATAVTNANATNVADSVRILLAGGTYELSAPAPTALPITFAGPSLTLEAESGTPILDGMDTVRLLSVAAAANVTIDGLEFQSGLSTGLGGAIENLGTLTVRNSAFSGNRGSNGGAITNTASGTLTVQDSAFSDNTTSGVGGGAIIAFGVTRIERSAIIGNTAPINGGGINVQPGGTVTLTSSTVAGNTSGGLGGGMSNLGTTTIQSSTIMDNTGTGGAAIATGNTNLTFAASIIRSPLQGGTCNPATPASYVDHGYNLDDDGTCIAEDTTATGSHAGTAEYGSSTYAEVLDAYLADAPAANGGPTETFALLNTPDPLTDLANPAFNIVPASFELPAAVDGVTAACSLSDQRGVVPAAGASCAIGAYLLQPTETAVSTPPEVVQNQSVTITAAVAPNAHGGTVAFNDGPGNPATAQCAAQPVANGQATCTVTYANLGAHQVTASYTGDGAGNNFTPSVSAPHAFNVAAAPPPPITPEPPILECTGREITILDIGTNSGRSTVRGLALASYSGQTVTLRMGSRRLGTSRVRADGSYSVRFRLPKTKSRPRLTALVAGEKSRSFAVDRRFVVLSRDRAGNRELVTVRVVGGKRGTSVTFRRQVSCAKSTPFRTIKLGRGGRFTISLPIPSATEGVAYFRARARIRARTTFTLPIAVTRRG